MSDLPRAKSKSSALSPPVPSSDDLNSPQGSCLHLAFLESPSVESPLPDHFDSFFTENIQVKGGAASTLRVPHDSVSLLNGLCGDYFIIKGERRFKYNVIMCVDGGPIKKNDTKLLTPPPLFLPPPPPPLRQVTAALSMPQCRVCRNSILAAYKRKLVQGSESPGIEVRQKRLNISAVALKSYLTHPLTLFSTPPPSFRLLVLYGKVNKKEVGYH